MTGPIWERSIEAELARLERHIDSLEDRMVKIEAYIRAQRAKDADRARLATPETFEER